MDKKYIRILDTTLRDGEQTPGVCLDRTQKVAIAKALEAFGVDTIEAGFPASSPGDFEAVRAVAREVAHCEVTALARCVPRDIDAVIDALNGAPRPVMHLVLGASDIHLERKLAISRSQALQQIAESVRYARRRMPVVQFSFEDATRAEPVFLRQCVYEAIEAGASRINIADTVGCATPQEFAGFIQDIVAFCDGAAMVSAHCHDDLGLATANAIAAVQAGAGQVEGTINGIGERAGNAAIEEVAVVLHLKEMATTGVDLSRIQALSRQVAQASGVAVQPNRAIVGENAFAHSSGIHQDGILKDPRNYQFLPPELVGAAGHRLVLTARSGRRAVAHVAQTMGFYVNGDELEELYRAVLRQAEESRSAVTESILERLIQATQKAVPAAWAL